MRKKILMIIVLLPVLVAAQTEKKAEVWQPLQFLEGTWEGHGQGSTVTQVFQFMWNNKFLQMKTKAVFATSEERPKGAIHEDMGLFSYDQSRKKFVLRAFYAEGYVNQYIMDDISEDGKTLTFVTEHVENAPQGTKAKLIFKIIADDEIEQSFHVAWPGREYSCYALNKLKRTK